MMPAKTVFLFLYIPLWLLLSCGFILHFLGILKRKAKTEREIDCIRRMWSPRRNPMLTAEEIGILRGIDARAFRGFRAARIGAAVGGCLWIAIMILRAVS